MAHITGGGLPDNVPRVLPKGTAVRIETSRIPKLPICHLIVQRGKVDRVEAYRVLNMGVGMVLFVRPEHSEAVVAHLHELGEVAFPLGKVVAGEQTVELA
jgi:phosphoribosylformylglycinamidine cyclo-ligase